MKTRTVRSITVLAAAGATAFAAPALASAEPIDIQPTPIGCPAGIGSADTETLTQENDLEVGQIEFEIEDEGAGLGQVNWLNLQTMTSGAAVLPDTDPEADDLEEPAVVLRTGEGLVVSVVWGDHRNSDGETCFLLPGVDITQVPGVAIAPAPTVT